MTSDSLLLTRVKAQKTIFLILNTTNSMMLRKCIEKDEVFYKTSTEGIEWKMYKNKHKPLILDFDTYF